MLTPHEKCFLENLQITNEDVLVECLRLGIYLSEKETMYDFWADTLRPKLVEEYSTTDIAIVWSKLYPYMINKHFDNAEYMTIAMWISIKEKINATG